MRPFKAFITTGMAAMLFGMACLSTSCDRLHEDLQPCDSGVRLRIVDYENMEESNVFYAQAHCLTLFVYDSEGNYLQKRTADREQIQDENWRMVIDLPAGHYRMLAYAGMECPDASFSFVTNPESTKMQDMEVKLDSEYLSPSNDKPLHYLFYGTLDLEIPEPGAGTTYTEATLRMQKDTNDVRILLANESGVPVDEADFDFNIIADNTLINYENNLLPAGDVTYWPWTHGNAEMGLIGSDEPAVVAYAELSVSRFVYGNPVTLLITRKSDGEEVVRIPLLNLLMLYKSERYSSWTTQQFFNHNSRWNLTFFLTGEGLWLRTKIVVNDWIVRINNITEM